MSAREAFRRHAPERLLVWRHRRHQRKVVQSWGAEQEAKRYMAERGSKVEAGPFVGTKLPVEAASWEQCAVIPFLRGSYEQEITTFMHAWAHAHPRGLFVDVGCAEGTFLAGMSRLGCRAVGFEIDPVRRRRARELASLNEAPVKVLSKFDPTKIELRGALLLMDVEGAEGDLIPQHADRFEDATVIVEFHHDSERTVIPALRASHDYTVIPFTGRDGLEEEHRPADQSWGLFEPKHHKEPSARSLL